MKTKETVWIAVLLAFALCLGACSRSKEEATNSMSSMSAAATPNLKRDAELLREATTKAAEARKRDDAAAAASAAGATVSPSPEQTTPAP